MDFALPPVPLPSTYTTDVASASARLRSALREKTLKSSEQLPVSKASQPPSPSDPSTFQKIRRVVTDSQVESNKFYIGQDEKMAEPPTRDQEGFNDKIDDAQTGVQGDPTKPNGDAVPDVAPGPGRPSASILREALGSRRSARSVSRGRTHVEKSIEATLANAEPGKNVRSRKSSHYMGLFKENNAASGIRLPESSSSIHDHRDATGENTSRRPSSLEEYSLFLQQDNITAYPGQPIQRHVDANEAGQHPAAIVLDQQLDARPSTSDSYKPSGLQQASYPQPISPVSHDHDPYFRKQDAVRQSSNIRGPPIPSNLLEQIREHHNLTPMRAQETHSSQQTLLSNKTDAGFINRRQLRVDEADQHLGADEEHIASAVYYPHAGHSPEDIEQLDVSPDEEAAADGSAKVALPIAEKSRPQNETRKSFIGPPEHIDISVKSEHEKSIFHGDYQPHEDEIEEEDLKSVRPAIGETVVGGASSAEESDVGSEDEIGLASQTDDAELTPTATPRKESYMQRRKRKSTTAGPKGAVMLEPYNHQVGGHSTVWKFSQQAICKQLNNRENEFYERIERRHPDMLRFLAR